jgi:hypothetical protein
MTAPNQLGEFLRARRSRCAPADVGLPSGLEGGLRMTIYQAAPGSRDHDAMTLLSMIANGEQDPGRLPSPGRPPA